MSLQGSFCIFFPHTSSSLFHPDPSLSFFLILPLKEGPSHNKSDTWPQSLLNYPRIVLLLHHIISPLPSYHLIISASTILYRYQPPVVFVVLQEGRISFLFVSASPVLAGFTPGLMVKSLSLMDLRAADFMGWASLVRLLRLPRAFITL